MQLDELRQHWNVFGLEDPYWAICTIDGKKGSRWDLQEFMQTGVEEIERICAYLASLGLEWTNGRALDFGCGVGRLTQALAPHFQEIYGVDIAASMIAEAREINRYPKRCNYLVNETDHLHCFEDESFDFIYSKSVFQHMEPRYTRGYLREFLRLLRPQGILLFQMHHAHSKMSGRFRELAHWAIPRSLRRILRKARSEDCQGPVMELYGIRRREIEQFVANAGAYVIDVQNDATASGSWTTYLYCVTRESR